MTALIAVAATMIGSHARACNQPSFSISLASAAVVATAPRQLWVWQQSNPKALVALARQYMITELLVWVSPGFTADPRAIAYLTELHSDAVSAGMQLNALGGDPSWASHPQTAGAWADEVQRSGFFGRLHLDIEPYALPGWNSKSAGLANGLLSALAAAKRSGLPVDADIPYWYNTITAGGGGPLDVAVMRLADSVTIMAYRNSTAAVLAVAATEMAHAATLGSRVWIGINIASPGGDPANTSFAGQSAAAVKRAAAAISAQAQQWPTFSGLALHDYSSLAVLK